MKLLKIHRAKSLFSLLVILMAGQSQAADGVGSSGGGNLVGATVTRGLRTLLSLSNACQECFDNNPSKYLDVNKFRSAISSLLDFESNPDGIQVIEKTYVIRNGQCFETHMANFPGGISPLSPEWKCYHALKAQPKPNTRASLFVSSELKANDEVALLPLLTHEALGLSAQEESLSYLNSQSLFHCIRTHVAQSDSLRKKFPGMRLDELLILATPADLVRKPYPLTKISPFRKQCEQSQDYFQHQQQQQRQQQMGEYDSETLRQKASIYVTYLTGIIAYRNSFAKSVDETVSKVFACEYNSIKSQLPDSQSDDFAFIITKISKDLRSQYIHYLKSLVQKRIDENDAPEAVGLAKCLLNTLDKIDGGLPYEVGFVQCLNQIDQSLTQEFRVD